MSKPLSVVPVIIVTLIALDGCVRLRISTPTVSNRSALTNNELTRPSPTPSDSRSGPESKAELAIRSIAVYGWWWSDEQLESNFDADNPPPKNGYLKLDKWDASQPDSPHPDRIDVICRVENHTTEPVDISLQVFADFKVASYETIARGAATQQAVDERLKQVPWSDNQAVGKLVINRLLSGEAREVRFKAFPLRSVIDKYFERNVGDLWPWKLRISTIAKNLKAVRVAYSEATIDLIPGD